MVEITKKCSKLECEKQARGQGDVCVQHGARVLIQKCNQPKCTNYAVKGGVCKKHGAKVVIKKCSHPKCQRRSRKGGVCSPHCTHAKAKKCSNRDSHIKVKTQGFPSGKHTKNLQLAQHQLVCCQYEYRLPKKIVIVHGSTRLTRSVSRVKPKE